MLEMKQEIIPIQLPDKDLELHYCDNGVATIWSDSFIPHSKKCILCFRGFHSFEKEYASLKVLRNLFNDYDFLFVENPGFGYSQNVMTLSLKDFLEELYIVYHCILRYKKYETIGIIGYEAGAYFCSDIYALIQQRKFILPSWIIHLNGIHTNQTYTDIYLPWYLSILGSYSKKKDCIQNYKSILIPLFLIHSKNNDKVSFLESIMLHQKLKPRSKLIILYGKHDTCLLSKENKKILMNKVIPILS